MTFNVEIKKKMNIWINFSVLVICVVLTLRHVPRLFGKDSDIPMEFGAGSFVSPGWEKVANTFREQLATGRQKGGAFAVYHKGKLVVDISGGYANDEAQVLYENNTLSALFSVSKAISAVVMAMLVDRELLDYSKPVSHYWPEFAQNGKDKVTVKQLLSHQAGVPATDEILSFFEFNTDPDKVERALAKQKPAWIPGEAIGYHAITLGLYEDQLVRRVDPKHRSLPQFFHEEVAIPFDIDLYYGLPKKDFYRYATVYPFSLFDLDLLFNKELRTLYWNLYSNSNELTAKVFANDKESTYGLNMYNNPLFMEANSPSTHGVGSAKGVAKVLGIVANGGKLKNTQLLSESLISQFNTPVKSGVDRVLGLNVTFGLGVTLKTNPMGGLIFGAPGAGGQMGWADTQYGLGWAYVMNHMSLYMDDPVYVELVHAMYDCVKSLP